MVGGGGDPLSEFDSAVALCEAAEKSYATFVCNDMIALFPHIIDFAGTLHPDKMHTWLQIRANNNYPMEIGSKWCHRSFRGFTHDTRDWQGSSGLFLTKIARELHYTHVVLCGVPMSVEADHFVRHQRWNAAAGFQRGWRRVEHSLRPYVRSVSGWTQVMFGAPTVEWLLEPIEDKHPVPHAPTPTRAPPVTRQFRPAVKA